MKKLMDPNTESDSGTEFVIISRVSVLSSLSLFIYNPPKLNLENTGFYFVERVERHLSYTEV